MTHRCNWYRWNQHQIWFDYEGQLLNRMKCQPRHIGGGPHILQKTKDSQLFRKDPVTEYLPFLLQNGGSVRVNFYAGPQFPTLCRAQFKRKWGSLPLWVKMMSTVQVWLRQYGSGKGRQCLLYDHWNRYRWLLDMDGKVFHGFTLIRPAVDYMHMQDELRDLASTTALVEHVA